MVLSKEEAKRLSIISVAEQLGMELKRTGSYSYNWVEHDSFVIDAKKNEFYWNSRTEFGDVIQLVQTIRGVSYKEAMHFLETGEFKAVDVEAQMASKEPFIYHLERSERQDFGTSRRYLKAQRGLSDDTINFFISQGSIAEAIRKKGDYFEPVIVFKYKDNTGFLAGASLQGIVENREHYPERGRLKQIMRNSDGQLGFSIDIGNPKRLVFAEAPIDLMSYYELHKDRLQDVRLVAMDGVKEGIISRRFMELYAEINDKSYQVNQNTGKALEVVTRTTNYFKDGQHQDMITLAVDNDMAGHKFITSLQEKGIPVQIAIPPILQRDQEKEDWNDFLKGGNNTPKELAHVYTVDEKSWHYQGFFEKELALAKAQELTTQDVKAFVSDVQLTKEEVRQKYQTIINQERGRKDSMSESYENGTKYEAEDVPSSPKKDDGFVIQPETQAIIDSGEVKQWAEHPNIYFVKGLRRVALELTEEGKFEQSSQYLPKTEEEKEVVNKLLSKQKKQDEVVLEDDQNSVLNIDTSNLSPEDAEWLKQNWHNISFSVEPKKQMVIDADKTVTYEKPSDPVGDTYEAQEEIQNIEKALEKSQEQNVNSEYQKNERTNGSQGSLQPKAEGSPTPVPEVGTFERSVTSRPTLSSHLLHFSINEEFQSSNDGHYHSISSNELAKLNRPIRSQTIQNAAQYYLDELANSKIYYVTPDKTVQVNFEEKHFMHLTGIKPLAPEQTPEKTLHDFAEGNGHFDNILLANNDAAFDKINVLSDLSVATESTSFYFDDLTNLRRYNGRFDSLIKSDDKDIILLFKELEEENYIPVSVFQSRARLVKELETVDKTPILAVFRERDGRIEQLSINEDYIKDGGKELQSIIENGLFEAIQLNEIDKNNYNVRLQWAEDRPGGPKLPFKEIELISYQDFARELYKANQSFYQLYQEELKQVTGGHPEAYISSTKIQFSIYAPDGELIQDGIRYNIGDEINPIAHKERLGTREMLEHPELMKIDGALFNQYHLERLASELDISQFSYALEDTPYADRLLSQVPFGVLENSPIGFSDSSHDSRLGFISFDGMDSVEVENLSAWFEKLGVKDSPMEQVALVEKWQKEIKSLSEKVEQTIATVRDEFEKSQEEEIKLEEQGHNKQELKRDADADGVSDDEELLQGTNPYDFRSKPGSKPDVEEGLQAEEVVLAAGSLAVADFTQNTDIGLYIRFNWSENKAIRDRFEEDELVPYEEFIEILYFENERLRPEGNGYYKTSFDIENEKGESYTFGIRYDIGSELYPLSEMMDERFSEEYIEYASKLDKKAIEKVQSELDETKNNRKEIIDADEELKAEEVVLATSSLAVADFIQNKDMAGLSRHLKEGIKEFLDSDKYKDYLTKMSQLNNYSNRNLRLILAQNPEARQVASFKQWKENFGRYVKKGEKALRIFKPMTKIKKDENNQPILDKNGKPETVTFFGLVPVFDVSQTEGKEMPKAAEVKEQLTDLDYANLYRALMTIAKENDVSVRFEEMENNKHGYYSVPENQIVLRSNEMNKAQIIKTFLHEMAHAELHHADNPQKENLTRSTAELQAESVAYVVSSYYGIDTSEYSFNYLSGWSADKETLADLEAQLDIVQQEAKSLMVRMDQALEQLRLSQEKQTKRSFEQKLEKFKDQSKQAAEDHKQELKADAQSKKEKGFSK